MKGNPTAFLIMFGLVWTAMVLAADKSFLLPMIYQIKAIGYPSTEGTMVSSQVKEEEGEDGPVHGVSVAYNYTVDGKAYTGQRYRYVDRMSSGSRWANNMVQNHPPGGKVLVYYDPQQPNNSLLAPGLQGSDLYLQLFITPFNVVMFAFWYFGWARLYRRWFKPPAGGIKLIARPRRTHARMNALSPLLVALITFGLLTFLGIFIVGFLEKASHPDLHTMAITWCLIIFGAVCGGVWRAYQVFSGKYDLIIDDLNSCLELPRTHGRKIRRRVPFANVESVYFDILTKPSNDGPDTKIYAPMLMLKEGEPKFEKLAEWYVEDRAREFVEWLRGKLPGRAKSSPPVPQEAD